MNIIRATVLGYCMGVRRAMETAEECLTKYADKQVYTFGPLIHNKQALLPLEEKGLKILTENDIANIKIVEDAFEKYYNKDYYKKSINYILDNTPNYFNFFYEFGKEKEIGNGFMA